MRDVIDIKALDAAVTFHADKLVVVVQVFEVRHEAFQVDRVDAVLIHLTAVSARYRNLLLHFRILHLLLFKLQELEEDLFSLFLHLLLGGEGIFLANFLQEVLSSIFVDVFELLAHLLDIIELVKAVEIDFRHGVGGIMPMSFLDNGAIVVLIGVVLISVVQLISLVLFVEVIPILISLLVEFLLNDRL